MSHIKAKSKKPRVCAQSTVWMLPRDVVRPLWVQMIFEASPSVIVQLERRHSAREWVSTYLGQGCHMLIGIFFWLWPRLASGTSNEALAV